MLNGANTAWILTSTALVLFMTLPALGLFYGGLVRAKNILSVLMHCMAIACLASLLWLAAGYSLAFAEGNGFIGGLQKAFLMGVGRDTVLDGSGLPETVFFMFQATFAIITPALIVGAYVERIKFAAVLLFSAVWLLVVYVPVTHWIWGGGWLAAMGVMDFAGGIVVHITAGVSALVIAMMLGRRRGYPDHIQPPHAPWMVMTGASMLWVGWYGFNAGSALAADGNAGMALLATHMSAATASLVWLAVEWKRFGKPSLVGIVTGTIAGLATVTPASGFVGPLAGGILGLAGGIVCYMAVNYIKNTLKIDDSLDVLAVHGVGGFLGTLLVAVLAGLPGGTGVSEGATALSQLGVQALAAIATLVWSALASWAIVKLCEATVGLRVGKDDEIEGLDYTTHGETGYNL
ncbi:MAG TPA: ammonium transporter [Rhodobacteraceae bacterium]|nr:ammonium transporter [Paracoccaceae bacterium]